MKYKVLIPYDNFKVFTGNYRRGRYQSDFVKWLTSNFGSVTGGMWGTERGTHGMYFKFREPSHAMVFKLMWGGA